MIPTDASLIELARRVSQIAPLSSSRRREILESMLRPIVRVAMRGHGQPAVVKWVRDQDSPSRSTDLKAWVSALACELCDRILARLDPLPSRETVVGL